MVKNKHNRQILQDLTATFTSDQELTISFATMSLRTQTSLQWSRWELITAVKKTGATANSTHHGIFHVIASVGDYSYNGVRPDRIVVHVVIVIHAWSHEWALWCLQTVELIIWSVLISEQREAHGLLTYRGKRCLCILFSTLSSQRAP